jgi:hypothetical protein
VASLSRDDHGVTPRPLRQATRRGRGGRRCRRRRRARPCRGIRGHRRHADRDRAGHRHQDRPGRPGRGRHHHPGPGRRGRHHARREPSPGGPGGRDGFRGADLDTAAGIIGISADEPRTALEDGATLAQVAQGKGIDQATLVGKLVAAAGTRVADAVKAGRLTRARADAVTEDLRTRITEQVTSTPPAARTVAAAPAATGTAATGTAAPAGRRAAHPLPAPRTEYGAGPGLPARALGREARPGTGARGRQEPARPPRDAGGRAGWRDQGVVVRVCSR